MTLTSFRTIGKTRLRSKPTIKSKTVKIIEKGTAVLVVSGSTKKVTEMNSKGETVTYTWKKIKYDGKYYWLKATLKKVKAKTSTVKTQSSAPKPASSHINYRERAIASAKEIFPLSYKYKCKHGEGGYTKALIKKNHRINCSGSCTAVLRDIGCLSSGRIYHRSASKNPLKKKNTFSKAVGGNIKGLKNCKIVKIGKKWKNIPKEYRVAGGFYVQDHNFFMYMDDLFYNCNKSGKIYTSASMYKKGMDSYCTSEPVLYAIIPNE